MEQLCAQGCEARLASLEYGEAEHIPLKRIGPITSLHYAFASGQVKALVKQCRPDIVNAHFATGYGFLAAMAVGHTIPIALNLWGSDVLRVPHRSFLHRAKLALAIEKAAIVFADSGYLLNESRRYGAIATSAIIPWGIERLWLSKFRADKVFSTPLRILVPRPHEEVYDNEFILRALSPLLRMNQCELTIPDWGSAIDAFQNVAKHAGIESITYYSRKTRTEFLTMMATQDVYLSASRSDSSPVSLIEAMAFGLVPVVADIPGVAEWVTNQNGVVYPLGNSRALHDTIAELTARDWTSVRKTNYERVKMDAVFEENVASHIQLMQESASARRNSG
jgi:glycosyltransferase involved in cell wall biosynthesis